MTECPFFVDFTRECLKEVGNLPADTLAFCTTERYIHCPFYRVIKKTGDACEHVVGCPVYGSIKPGEFEAFVMISSQYCLSENNVNCKRYVLKKQGKLVPPELLPDGSMRKG